MCQEIQERLIDWRNKFLNWKIGNSYNKWNFMDCYMLAFYYRTK